MPGTAFPHRQNRFTPSLPLPENIGSRYQLGGMLKEFHMELIKELQ